MSEAWRQERDSTLVEPVPAQEVCCDGLAAVFVHPNGQGEFHLFRWETVEGEQCQVLVARIFVPMSVVPAAIERVVAKMRGITGSVMKAVVERLLN